MMAPTSAVFHLAVGLLVAVFLSALSGVSAREIDAARMALERRYSTPHSLGDNYVFDPRDGWQTVNTTNLLYKYAPRATPDSALEDGLAGLDDGNEHTNHTLLARARKTSHAKPKTASKKVVSKKTSSKSKTTTDLLKGGVGNIVNTIKGIGKPEPVVITWYTGHDLLNPSCWANPTWAPTDQSFAAALTLDGWTSKPQCFKFLELCNTPKKCVFVRVVDSCAGCAKGSKHVDLTKAAFLALAALEQGLLTVHMREATDPVGW
ncbi:hypothetical protein C8Q76DRAFT_720646 [Earliella scabrosa]|nr:hypothetical protein C8Q76DRAFT_720646 [Earliella scabrosa]